MRTKFADPVRILPLRAGFGKVRSPHFTPALDNTAFGNLRNAKRESANG